MLGDCCSLLTLCSLLSVNESRKSVSSQYQCLRPPKPMSERQPR